MWPNAVINVKDYRLSVEQLLLLMQEEQVVVIKDLRVKVSNFINLGEIVGPVKV
ncbi:hypothetical protein HanRHA438_Chr08g0354071 [Helianthus annuus]|nr:hypothetical protein HanRHA438_Chr08g0354071 [Helianthus annuus]